MPAGPHDAPPVRTADPSIDGAAYAADALGTANGREASQPHAVVVQLKYGRRHLSLRDSILGRIAAETSGCSGGPDGCRGGQCGGHAPTHARCRRARSRTPARTAPRPRVTPLRRTRPLRSSGLSRHRCRRRGRCFAGASPALADCQNVLWPITPLAAPSAVQGVAVKPREFVGGAIPPAATSTTSTSTTGPSCSRRNRLCARCR